MAKRTRTDFNYRIAAGSLLLIHSLLGIFVQILKFGISENFSFFLSSTMPGYVASTLIMQGLCILLPSIYIFNRYKLPAHFIPGKSSSTGGWTIISAMIGLPAAIFITGLNNGLTYFLLNMGIKLPAPSSFSYDKSFESITIIIILTVLLPAISEEFMFRGVIQNSLAYYSNDFVAILVQAITFSVFHIDTSFVLAPFLAGLLLGLVRQRTGSIYASILTHIAMNLTIVFINPILPSITQEYLTDLPSNPILYASLAGAGLASVALIPLLAALLSIKAPKQRRTGTKVFFPFDLRYLLGFLILLGSMIFFHFSTIER